MPSPSATWPVVVYDVNGPPPEIFDRISERGDP